MKRFVVVGGAAIAVMALGAAPASAALDCGDSISEDTKLKHDITCPAGAEGLAIIHSNVTLDLNGHRIMGEEEADTVGVLDIGLHGVTVENGTIRGFGTGVYVDGDAATVKHLTIRSSDGDSVVLDGSDGSSVTDNLLEFPYDQTIDVANDSDSATISDNLLKRGGMRVSGGSDARVTGNTINETSGSGPSATTGIILVDNTADAVVTGNLVKDAEAYGIQAASVNEPTIKNNEVVGSGLDGIVTQTAATGLKIIGNQVADGDGDGIDVGSGTGGGAVVRKNHVTGSALDGIRNADGGTAITRNTANHNGVYGVDAPVGNAHDNIAKQNGNPAQCNPAGACNT